MSTPQTSHSAVQGIDSAEEDRIALRQRSRRLGRLVFAFVFIASTIAAARGMTAKDKSHHDGHPGMRERIACMC